ncbi:MAG TPA: glycosyltransferase family 39 protein, partial [Tepidisphaeraceae bacterium]|nr:glycosyltransferase family 39 protein [Tepidisphaeraceae bacterium]
MTLPTPATSATDAQSSRTFILRVWLFIILLVAVLLRLINLSAQSFWLDELWTIEVSAGQASEHRSLPVDVLLTAPPDLTHAAGLHGFTRIWTGMDQIIGPPLYHIALRVWMFAFGESESAIRSFSALCSSVAVFLLFFCRRPGDPPQAALWGCAVMAVAGPQIVYAQETRPYAMMLALGLAAVVLVQRVERLGPTAGRLAALWFVLLCLLLTHYFAVGAPLAVMLYAAAQTRGRTRIALLLTAAAAGLCFAVCWLPFMSRQVPQFSVTDRAAAFLAEQSPNHLVRTGWRLATLPISLLCDRRPIPMYYASGLLIYLAAAVLAWRRRIWSIWPVWFAGIVAVPGVLDLLRATRHLEYIRYSLLAGPAVYIVIAHLFFESPRFRFMAHIVPAVVVLCCVLQLRRAYDTQKPDYRAAAAVLRASASGGDVIVFAGPRKSYAPQVLYLGIS